MRQVFEKGRGWHVFEKGGRTREVRQVLGKGHVFEKGTRIREGEKVLGKGACIREEARIHIGKQVFENENRYSEIMEQRGTRIREGNTYSERKAGI